jgi:4-amino-4-deoxy-L-arabinose transferase-like glycosyltransferase
VTSPSAQSRRSAVVLFACLAIGAALRFWMIGKDIPFSINIDEPDVTGRALHMVKTGSLNPNGFFDYPTLAIYLQFVVVIARFLAGTLTAEWRSLNQVSAADFYLWARVATAMMGVCTIYVVYRVASRWGSLAAIVAAAVMAVQPWHVLASHYALTDVPLTLCVALTMLASLRASEEGRLRWFALAGAAAGLAAATKYNGVLVIIVPLTHAMLRPSRRTPFVLTTLGGAAAAFLLGAPYTILDLPGFLNGFAELSQHFNHGGRAWAEAAAIYIKHFRTTGMGAPGGLGAFGWLVSAVGWLALTLCATGLAILARRTRRRAERPTALGALLFAAAYFWLIAHSSGQLFARYALPLVPVMCLGLGVGSAAALTALARRVKTPSLRRSASAAVLALAIIPPLLMSALWDRDQAKVSIARVAMDWMETHVRPTDRIVVETHGFRPAAPRFRTENIERLIDRTMDDYRADGTVYLIAIAEEFNKFMEHPQTSEDLAAAAAYQTLFRSTEEVGRFTAGPHNEHPGSEIRILKIPR